MLGLIDRFLNETAVIEARVGTDAYSGNQYGAPVSTPVRWHSEHKVVRDDQGREVISDSHISLTASVSVGDRVTDEWGRKREVVAVRINRSTTGVFSHYVAYLA